MNNNYFKPSHLAWLIPFVLVWISYANMYFSSFFSGREHFSWEVIFVDSLILLLLWGITHLAIKKRSEKGKHLSIIFFIFLLLVLTLLNLVFYLAHKQYLIVWYELTGSLSWLHVIINVSSGLMTSFVIVSVQYFLFYQEQFTQASMTAANLEKENSKAHLNALQTQVNPHFLFNNLNTLQSLINSDNTNAQNFLIELSQLYRYLLNKKDMEVVPLSEEIVVAKKFNYLIQQRFGSNYQCEIKISDAEKNNFYLPPFTLQMLLENVIKHNRIDDEHLVTCTIKSSNGNLEISNNLMPKNSAYESNNIGLENLRKRYKILSDKEISIFKDENKFVVTVPLLQINSY